MLFRIKNILTIHLLLLSLSTFIMSMEQGMPLNLFEKLYVQQLAPQCAFLASIGEDDCESVNWMLQNHPIPEGKHPLECFSIYPSEVFKNELTPMGFATYKKNDSMVNILKPLQEPMHTVTSLIPTDRLDSLYFDVFSEGINSVFAQLTLSDLDKQGLIKGPLGNVLCYRHNKYYPLYIAACSKNITPNLYPLLQRLKTFTASRTGNIQLLLLIITMNNDIHGLNLLKTHTFDNNKENLNNWLGLTFTCAVGLGNNKTPFNTEDEIKQLMNYPILKNKKPTLLKMLNICALAATTINYNIFNNVQIQKAARILENAILSEQQTQELS